MIVKIFDEDCSGLIKKEEFGETLQAYGINQESQGHARTFGQESLIKYCQILISKHLD